MTVDAAITLLIALLNNSSKISALIQQATAEGRDITDAEWAAIKADDDAARQALVDALK